MDTIVCDVAKNRLEKDFNKALVNFGLFVSSIRFDESNGFSIIIEILPNKDDSILYFLNQQ